MLPYQHHLKGQRLMTRTVFTAWSRTLNQLYCSALSHPGRSRSLGAGTCSDSGGTQDLPWSTLTQPLSDESCGTSQYLLEGSARLPLLMSTSRLQVDVNKLSSAFSTMRKGTEKLSRWGSSCQVASQCPLRGLEQGHLVPAGHWP